MRAIVLILSSIALVGCGPQLSDGHEQLPAPSFEAKLPMLRDLAAEVTVPSRARQDELRDLLEMAYAAGINPRLAMQAERQLHNSQDRAWVLEEALDHEIVDVRAKAAFGLGRCRQPSRIFPMLHRLKYETNARVRLWLGVGLAELGNHSGLPDLVSAMDDVATARDAGLQAMAICQANGIQLETQPSYGDLEQALGELYSRWQETGRACGADGAVIDSDARVQARVAGMLVALTGFDLRLVDDARYILRRAGVLGLPLLKQALGASENYLRFHALEIVTDLGIVAAPLAEAVLPLLADPLARTLAVRALGELRVRQAVPRLLAMSYSEDLELRTAVALSLGPLGDRRGLKRLRELFSARTQPMDVRVAAAFSLAIFETERPAYRFLLERRAKGDFHPPTIEELIERVDSWR